MECSCCAPESLSHETVSEAGYISKGAGGDNKRILQIIKTSMRLVCEAVTERHKTPDG